MKYALLVYVKPGSHESLSESEYAAVRAEYLALREEPDCVGGAQLAPLETATSVRMKDGDTLITDGPFAETKEVFGGFYLIDAPNLDGATELAARIPTVRLGGTVEIRPLAEA